MPTNKTWDHQVRETVKFCKENDFDHMLNFIKDRIGLPEPRATLFRVYSQNNEGSKFISKRVHAISKEEAAVIHKQVWPDLVVTKVADVW